MQFRYTLCLAGTLWIQVSLLLVQDFQQFWYSLGLAGTLVDSVSLHLVQDFQQYLYIQAGLSLHWFWRSSSGPVDAYKSHSSSGFLKCMSQNSFLLRDINHIGKGSANHPTSYSSISSVCDKPATYNYIVMVQARRYFSGRGCEYLAVTLLGINRYLSHLRTKFCQRATDAMLW